MCLFSMSGKQTYCYLQPVLQLNVGVLLAPSVFLWMWCECYVLPLTLHNGIRYVALIRCDFQKALQLLHARQFSKVCISDKAHTCNQRDSTGRIGRAKDAGRVT